MYRNLILTLIVFAMHCNDVKISVVKVSEIILIIYGILQIDRFHKTSRLFLAFFTLWLIVTFIHNFFIQFDRSVVVSILQEPYICSIGRYMELFSCIAFVELVVNYLREDGDGLDKILYYNVLFCLLILIFYFFEKITSLNVFGVITHTGRLRGFFNEGGPFGLLISMLLILSFLKKRNYLEKIILILCLVFSFSKAGIILLLLFVILYYARRFRHNTKIKLYIYILFVPGIFLSSILVYYVIQQYSISWFDADSALQYAQNNSEDTNFVAGRVAGKYIVTNMVVENPLIGIGLGNYPILRNLNEYRSFFPIIKVYDAHGFGGIVTVLCEFGLLGLFVFFCILRYKAKRSNPYLIFLFICVFMCGVQITFIYPWLLIGMNEFYCRIKIDGKHSFRLPLYR